MSFYGLDTREMNTFFIDLIVTLTTRPFILSRLSILYYAFSSYDRQNILKIKNSTITVKHLQVFLFLWAFFSLTVP